MSFYVFDTDSLSLLLHGHPDVCRRAAAHDPAELSLSVVTVEETLTGWYAQIRRAKKDEQVLRAYSALQETVQFCGRVRILPFDAAALARFQALRAAHRRTGTNDLRMAAITLIHDGTLVTRNSRDFKDIPGLKLEDWAAVK
jgi:tRNA(fMet)-specific endonuclease VapC